MSPFEKLAADRLRMEPAAGSEELLSNGPHSLSNGDLLSKTHLHSHLTNGYVNALLMSATDLEEGCEGEFLPKDIGNGLKANGSVGQYCPV